MNQSGKAEQYYGAGDVSGLPFFNDIVRDSLEWLTTHVADIVHDTGGVLYRFSCLYSRSGCPSIFTTASPSMI
jgi:hypothetical protein